MPTSASRPPASGWHTPVPDGHPAAAFLSAEAVRSHCREVMARAQAGEALHFHWQAPRLGATAAFVAETIRARYPDLQVPYHSRWRHFEAGGIDRWASLARRAGLDSEAQREERARVRIDLVIPSVLLDAGAGPDWHYVEPGTGLTLARSEGLGVASLALFESGALSADPAMPLRSDAAALAKLKAATIASAFQAGSNRPLVGLEGRSALLARLGQVIAATPAVFGTPARLGHLFDYLKARANEGRIEAGFVLATLLRALGPVWPSRIALQGVPLGDCWTSPSTRSGLLPLHKLTQWLTYSLLEPLEEAGLRVTGLDALTGLPEYRNGGLLIDTGLLVPRDAGLLTQTLGVDHPAVIEWRALTVAALDAVADAVRAELGVTAEAFPLARVLEGGTWAAGRRIAAERRPGGAPPLRIASDGTVF